MHTVAGQLTDVGSAETASGICPQIEMIGGMPHGTHAGGKTVEVALEGLEAQVPVIHQLTAVEVAVVKAQTSVQSPTADVGRRGDEGTEVKQAVVRNQELVALVERALPHAAHATGDAPVFTQASCHIVDVVVHRVQLDVKPILIGLLKFLATVLLISQHGIESPLSQIDSVVKHGLVMIHLLVRQTVVIGLGVGIGLFQFTCLRVTLTLGNTGCDVEIGPYQARVTPGLVDTQHTRQGTLAELGVGHIAVTRGLVGMGKLVTIADVPCPTLLVAAIVKRVVHETTVGMIFSVHIQAHLAQRHYGIGVEFEDTRQCVRAIEQARGSLEHLDRTHGIAVNLHTVLVAPLLPLLAHAVGNNDHTVISQSADDGLGNAAAGTHLRHTRQLGHRINDVGGRSHAQAVTVNDSYRHRHVLHLYCTGRTGDDHLFQFYVAKEHVGRVKHDRLLSCHRAHARQQQKNRKV